MRQSHIASLLMLVLSVGSFGQHKTKSSGDGEWPAYGRDPGGSRYSPLKQIDRSNIKNLKAVWTFRTGASDARGRSVNNAAFEATPILVDGTLYLSTPFNRVIALDPAKGTERWSY